MNTKIDIKAVKTAAAELNEKFELNPPINLKLPPPDLTRLVKEATKLIEPGDKFTKETQAVIDALSAEEKPAKDAKPVAKPAAKSKPAPKPEEDEDADSDKDETEDDDHIQDLIDEINDAETLDELKEIASDNDEFKSIAKKLSTYKTVGNLRSVMIDILEPEQDEDDSDDEEVEEEKPAAKKPAAKETPNAPEKKAAEPKAKAEKAAPVKKSAYSRSEAIVEGLQKGKPKTFEDWAVATNKAYIAHGGKDNIKESRNLIKMTHKIFLALGIEIPTVG